uniref:Coatomer subunit delta n=1 Tax=Branchiostoma floridae TaxID=7739 RepID=C3XZB0_BRAFL|eukprot:XP_002610664.1 hypothetical protein BRAFLDRAFT_260557 [Branchiostoma floridae]
MVLLAAAVCTKSGKAIISRQFVEMTRSRIEGLLAAFPKLMNTGKQHTFVETESVRYVYQPLEKLYMLLITTKNSNILEDLETLRLFSRVIPEYCKVMEESEIVDQSFPLIFAFDEIVALGYRENVNLAQIRTFTEMDSHEEKVFKAVRESQEREAIQEMKKKAKELQAARREAERTGKKNPGFGGGFGGGSRSSGESVPVMADDYKPEPSKPTYTAPKPSPSGRAMKLGSKGKDVDHFVDKLVSEGQEVASTKASRQSAQAAKIATPAIHTESVHLRIEEKVTLTARRDGGLDNMEIHGMISLRISDEQYGKIIIAVENQEARGAQIQTHPNVDKKLFQSKSEIGLKNPNKPFPINNDIGVMRWRLQSNDESLMPLSINCWPTESSDGCDVNVEYELEQEQLELNDVVISIPLPSGGGAPVVGDLDGEYHVDSRRGMLEWRLPVIDASNKSGSLEFSCHGHSDDFFPVSVSFVSTKSYCDVMVSGIRMVDGGQPVKYSSDTALLVEKYEIL